MCDLVSITVWKIITSHCFYPEFLGLPSCWHPPWTCSFHLLPGRIMDVSSLWGYYKGWWRYFWHTTSWSFKDRTPTPIHPHSQEMMPNYEAESKTWTLMKLCWPFVFDQKSVRTAWFSVWFCAERKLYVAARFTVHHWKIRAAWTPSAAPKHLCVHTETLDVMAALKARQEAEDVRGSCYCETEGHLLLLCCFAAHCCLNSGSWPLRESEAPVFCTHRLITAN